MFQQTDIWVAENPNNENKPNVKDRQMRLGIQMPSAIILQKEKK